MAAWALGEIGDQRAIEPLVKALKDKYSSVREAVVNAIGRIGVAQAVEPLVSMLHDEHSGVRLVALRALHRLEAPESKQALIEYFRQLGEYTELDDQLLDFARSLYQFEAPFDSLFEKFTIEKIESVHQKMNDAAEAENSEPKRFYSFLDQALDEYVSADQITCERMREKFGRHPILLRYLLSYAELSKKELRKSGEVKWLVRGVAAVSLLDGREDIRDISCALNEIHNAARDTGISPEPYFHQVGAISNSEKPETPSLWPIRQELPTRQWLMEFCSYKTGSDTKA